MNYELKIRFPKQKQDYKEANRIVRKNLTFREFVTGRSKDFRELYLDFKSKDKYDILALILVKTLQENGYVVEIID